MACHQTGCLHQHPKYQIVVIISKDNVIAVLPRQHLVAAVAKDYAIPLTYKKLDLDRQQFLLSDRLSECRCSSPLLVQQSRRGIQLAYNLMGLDALQATQTKL
jgi:hypothetical protein